MRLTALTIILSFLIFTAQAQSNYVRLSTQKGNILIMLYDNTPNHRDNFIRLVRKGLFKDQEFNRVIKNFVSQGGELDETILEREKLNPGNPAERLAAEIRPDRFHKKGALGAGRDENPEKSSYFDQIYLVEGKIQTDAELDEIEIKKGIKFSAAQRQDYKKIGGIPRLDQDYTVFGEIVKGLEVAEAINKADTDQHDRPLKKESFTLTILNRKEAEKLIRP
ncbi:peptidyl-prolyl cis-trans isomerase B (cyclophilin B) [Pedobacter cryoconitis]|uniref:peptidylprolyl isomerase n=1 Tax=Pedobacter cryoconitis TaxID=188932 RepID=UPI001613AF5B|nr:peptidylprolyl isomerase [Pedobacter cryoconitis]MBB6272068.1 peptidyl-prolyl cis-trans isomerase B (cyclophilin B) [Pedobacter cryoconitis]